MGEWGGDAQRVYVRVTRFSTAPCSTTYDATAVPRTIPPCITLLILHFSFTLYAICRCLTKGAGGMTALMYASFRGHKDNVRELIAADGSAKHIRMKSYSGMTALMKSSYNGQEDIVRELIAADGSVEHIRMRDNGGVTALSYASMYGCTDVVRLLIAADGSAEHLNYKVRS